ncbi:hypothetical protein C2S52_021529 [Perilla frutescens var. hirtella]|uniref:Uncharacterized protein n=1 Tax=Perilla frutescens var. hirtella TaxID=608512 RepID=A0AAD4JPJ3_PERFH|nr:hypothetical protein C2S52_021529 [Perilla frutescens var. hirtella]KAH6808034.1 hypothetical protein C2S51_029142 [Perilla frutescens var. frutescens]KAH6837622.1 hypothetical protein C2S53_014170 [Perilla frutescens var. hirtella]
MTLFSGCEKWSRRKKPPAGGDGGGTAQNRRNGGGVYILCVCRVRVAEKGCGDEEKLQSR